MPPPNAAAEAADVLLGERHGGARERLRPLRRRERSRRVDLRLALRLHEQAAGLREAGPRLGADRAAAGDEVVLGGLHPRSRGRERASQLRLRALHAHRGLACAGDRGIDLGVHLLDARVGRERIASGGAHRRADRRGIRSDPVGECRGVRVAERTPGLHVVLEIGDAGGHGRVGGGEVRGEAVHGVREQVRLVDGLLGRADADRGIARPPLGDRGRGLVELLPGEAQSGLGLPRVVRDGGDGGGRVLPR